LSPIPALPGAYQRNELTVKNTNFSYTNLPYFPQILSLKIIFEMLSLKKDGSENLLSENLSVLQALLSIKVSSFL